MKNKILTLIAAVALLTQPAFAATKKKPLTAPKMATAGDCYTLDDVPVKGIGVCFDASNPSEDVVGYRIEYGNKSGEAYNQIVTLDAATTRALLSGLDPSQQYFIIVKAFNALGEESPPSNEANGYPKRAPIPNAPTNLRVIGSEPPRLTNISTRGILGEGDGVMIGGFILGNSAKVVVRAISPSLAQYGLDAASGASITIFDSSGNMIATNTGWQNGHLPQELADLKLAPKDPRESALVATLNGGSYTAIVRGTGDKPTGIGMVEVFDTGQ